MNLLDQQIFDSSPLIVVGMHRSGTSLFARLLSKMGMHMGARVDMNHEAIAFKQVNIELLHQAGADWTKPERFFSYYQQTHGDQDWRVKTQMLLRERNADFGNWSEGQAWGWKDPRNSLTLPIWLDLFPNAKIVHVVRNGVHVALSLARREPKRFLMRTDAPRMFPPTIVQGYKLWGTYLQILHSYEKTYQQFAWKTLKYENLIEDPVGVLVQVAEFAALDVSTDAIRTLASKIVSAPTRMSQFERRRVNFYIRTGMIKMNAMEQLYSPLDISELLNA